MDLQNIIKSKYFRWTLIAIMELVLLSSAFGMGMFVGFHKANFSYQWGENYHRNFGGPSRGFMREGEVCNSGMMKPGEGKPGQCQLNQFDRPEGGNDLLGRDFIDAYGVTGLILKIEGNVLVIKDKDNTEKTVVVTDKTALRANRENLQISDLKVDDMVVVIGNPNDAGQIEAKLIRLFLNRL